MLDSLGEVFFRSQEADQVAAAIIKEIRLPRVVLAAAVGGTLALVQEPTVMLLDEPTSSLDLKNQLEILRTIDLVVQEHELAAVMTMHDLSLAFSFAHKFLFLKDGSIYHHGGIEGLTPEMVEVAYGVQVDILNHQGNLVIVPKYKPKAGYARNPIFLK